MVCSYAVRTDMTIEIRKEYLAKLDAMSPEELIREFITYLDYTEETDSGREFHPIEIGCVRVLMAQPLNEVLKRLRKI